MVSVNRTSDTNYWTRRNNRESLVPNGRDSPIPRGAFVAPPMKSMIMIVAVASDLRLDEKPISRPTTPPVGVDRVNQV